MTGSVTTCRPALAELTPLAAAQLAVPASLRLVEHHPGTRRDGDREHDQRQRDRPRKYEKQDEADDDPGESQLRVRCHADSVSFIPGPGAPDPAQLLSSL